MAKNVVDQLKSSGRVQRARLGVIVQPMTADLAAGLNLTDVRGALVSQVAADTPAARAGLKQGDVILAVEGRPVADGNDLRNAVANTEPGKSITVTIVRDGRQQSVTARLEAMPTESKASVEGAPAAKRASSGCRCHPRRPEVAERLSLPASSKGIVVTDVDPDGQAAAADVQPGDVIEQINGRPTRSVR